MKTNLTLILLLFLLNINYAYSYQIVYPQKISVEINADKTFFIGNVKQGETLRINNQDVNIHKSGGFKHTVPLSYGENRFVIDNGETSSLFKIIRPEKLKCYKEVTMKYYTEPIKLTTVKDNVPLRSTPFNAGLNRLVHLQNNIDLKSVGEYGDFYKVQLARDDYAWIMKSDVEKSEYIPDKYPAMITDVGYNISDNTEIFKYKLTKKLPYSIYEGNVGYDLTIYGINEEIYKGGRYEFHIARDTKKFGYKAYYNDNNELIVIIKKFVPNLKDIVFTIDPGHGGSEYGAIGCLGDKEKDINLKIAKKLKNELEKLGAKVHMTRENDINIGLNERVNFANKRNTNIFISIHANALPDSLADKDASGVEVYYFHNQAKQLAADIAEAISQNTGQKNGGARAQSFAVVRNSEALSIIVETGYLINPDENEKLREDRFQDLIVEGIINGLENYLK